MLDGHNRRHTVAHIRARKIGILFLQNTELPGVRIDHRRKNRLKTRDMGPALSVKDIIAETKNIFVKFIGILKCGFHRNPFCLAPEIDYIVQNFAVFIYIPDESADSFFLVIDDMLRRLAAPVLVDDCERRV